MKKFAILCATLMACHLSAGQEWTQQEDGSWEVVETNRIYDGCKVKRYHNGAVENIMSNGIWNRNYPDGSSESYNPNPGGRTKHNIYKNGVRIEISDGNSVTLWGRDDVTLYYFDGEWHGEGKTWEKVPDGYVFTFVPVEDNE